jgi:hypothetical protein
MTTLLAGVNAVLNRVHITSVNGPITSLTDQGRQVHIDLCVQLWNEAIDTLYDLTGAPRPQEAASSNITLVTDQREYDLPSDLVQIRWPLIDETNGNEIREYPGGYEQMRIDQLQPSQWTGLPLFAAINPVTSDLRMDTAPTSEQNGYVFKLLYDQDNALSAATDVIPVPNDATYRALVAAIAEVWEMRKRDDFEPGMFRSSLARAASFMSQNPRRTHW